MYIFGSGALIITPSGTAQTPVNIGLVQEVSIDETTELKELFGQGNRALAVGAGTIKATGKAKVARVSGLAMASLLYGVTPVIGQTATAFAEAGTIPAVSIYTVTVANSATWTVDQGVVYAASGLPFKRVASAPTVGQYSVSAGVYTFAAADANAKVLLSYNYTVAATGQNIPIASRLIGSSINFSINLYGQDPTNGSGYSLQLYNCVASKLGFQTKITDFTIPEFDFMYYANAAGAVGQWNFGDSF